jgi:hypothetical protein
MHTVIFGADIRFWPTLNVTCHKPISRTSSTMVVLIEKAQVIITAVGFKSLQAGPKRRWHRMYAGL